MSITQRTVFYDYTGGYVRFWDWAEVNTSLGMMVQPFLPNDRHMPDMPFDEFDPTDEVALITSIELASVDRLNRLSGGVHVLHGGAMNPRNSAR